MTIDNDPATKKSIKKVFSAVMALAMLVVILFSVYFITLERHHTCHQKECPICACMEQCEGIISQYGMGAIILLASVLPVIILYSFIGSETFDLVFVTPVSRKVRLNN
ncbi:MAG: hypothetical protein K5888_01350 [Lachnospiraceae bacterium]|nr:hypothetical protein [Lachnospiraceae bacterium]